MMSTPMLMLACRDRMPMKKITQLMKPFAEMAFRFFIGMSVLPHFWQINDVDKDLSVGVFIIAAFSQFLTTRLRGMTKRNFPAGKHEYSGMALERASKHLGAFNTQIYPAILNG